MPASAQSVPPSAGIWFDIPAQPLVSALDAYAVTTGTVAIYNGNLAWGRTSHAVQGALQPRRALPILLKGTGLTGEFTTEKAFVIVPLQQRTVVTTPHAIASGALPQEDTAQWRYAALVQRGVADALCKRTVTAPGSYRAAIRVWIGPTGSLTRVQLLDSTGDQARDTAITEIAGRVSLGEPPPQQMAGPVTMVLLPRSSGGEINCPVPSYGSRNG